MRLKLLCSKISQRADNIEEATTIIKSHEEESRTKWEPLTMNLAFLLAKLGGLNLEQQTEGAEWLDE